MSVLPISQIANLGLGPIVDRADGFEKNRNESSRSRRSARPQTVDAITYLKSPFVEVPEITMTPAARRFIVIVAAAASIISMVAIVLASIVSFWSYRSRRVPSEKSDDIHHLLQRTMISARNARASHDAYVAYTHAVEARAYLTSLLTVATAGQVERTESVPDFNDVVRFVDAAYDDAVRRMTTVNRQFATAIDPLSLAPSSRATTAAGSMSDPLLPRRLTHPFSPTTPER